MPTSASIVPRRAGPRKLPGMQFLCSLRRKPAPAQDPAVYPWLLPLVQNLAEIEFTAPVTFLVGENGCGKSTLLEGIAAGMDAVAAGSRDLRRDPTLAAAREFAKGFTFVRRRHARTRLFLRAEDVFGFTGRVVTDMAELEADASELAATLPDGYGRLIATAAVHGPASCAGAQLRRQPGRPVARRDLPRPPAPPPCAAGALFPR